MSGCGNPTCKCGDSCSCNGCSCKRSMDTFPSATSMKWFEDEGCNSAESCSWNASNYK